MMSFTQNPETAPGSQVEARHATNANTAVVTGPAEQTSNTKSVEADRKGTKRKKPSKGAAWRERNEEKKKRKLARDDYRPAIYTTEFSKDEIAAEERRPKRKVAVMIGYAGTGYHGMQLSDDLKTIEGDLFQAFVKAGAVSKANADDPKKVSFARCARTDKGVHAAGNMISLKLIIEDEDIVEKINSHLPPQIRVWGIERTSNGFSSYNFCDSRMYEYLIPTHCFLPPHPRSHLGRNLQMLAEASTDSEGFQERQAEVADFWKYAETSHIDPALQGLDPTLKDGVYKRVFEGSSATPIVSGDNDPEARGNHEKEKDLPLSGQNPRSADAEMSGSATSSTKETPLEQGIRRFKAAVLEAKKAWRIGPQRLARVKDALSRYGGVHNYHNYTVQKVFHDPSSKRIIKSFVVSGDPILIGGTEWLSLKVHGQSFMMHQIRKMVGMAALAVRCGTNLDVMRQSMQADKLSIPKVPGLGLLLERPVFEAYNQKLKNEQGGPEKHELDYDKHKEEMDEFKDREIYQRMYREEEAKNEFHQLFWAIDSLPSSQFLYLSSKGLAAVEKGTKVTELKQSGELVDLVEGEDDEDNEDS